MGLLLKNTVKLFTPFYGGGVNMLFFIYAFLIFPLNNIILYASYREIKLYKESSFLLPFIWRNPTLNYFPTGFT